MSPFMTSVERRALLVEEAKRWIGIQEVGNNRGQIIDLMHRITKVPAGSPWCMSFVQFCISAVDRQSAAIFEGSAPSKIKNSAHVLTVWNEAPETLKSKRPRTGDIAIWRQRGTSSGHTGIVIAVPADGSTFESVEGNTSPSASVDREGDGVFLKRRLINPTGSMELLGFLRPWGDV